MINQRFNISLCFVVALLCSGNCPAALDEAAEALQDKDFAAAMRYLEEASQEERDAPQWQLLRAAAEAGKGDLKEAEKRYLALIKRTPQMPEAYNNLAAIYARQGRLDEAMKLLEKAMKTNESYATIYANLRSIYYEMSRSAYARALQMEKREDGPALKPILVVAAAEQPRQTMAEAPQAAVEAPAKPVAVKEPPTRPVAVTPPAAVKEPPPRPVAVTPPAAVDKPQTRPVNIALVGIDGVAAQPQQGPGAEDMRRDEVIAMLQRWAADWAGQRVDAYLTAYADEFQPRQGMSREQWQAQRRKRLSRAQAIDVQLSDFKVQFKSEGQASVTLVQSYRSDNYSDRVRKHLRLLRAADGWKIVTERTIEVL